MAITILDPGMIKAIADFWGYITVTSWDGNTANLSDSANATPVFDTDHAVYTNPIVDQASQNSIGDNSNGLEDPLHLDPVLSYAYSRGYTNTRSSSQTLTVGVTQAFDYDFLGVGGGTTLSASGTFTWGQGSSEDKTTTVTEQLGAPFDIPRFKIYEEKLLFTQETAAVPYTTTINVDGTFRFTNENGFVDIQIGRAFNMIEINVDTPPAQPPKPYKDVDWRDIRYVTDNRGSYLLHGTLTLEDAGTATVKIYDITKGSAQDVRAEYDPAVPVGVHRTMDDAGRRFVDTPFDDWVDGGEGDDTIRLSGGEDIVHAGGGDDRIVAVGVSRSLLDGGDGNDVIRLVSDARYNTLHGGDGDDRIHADAPASMIYGGPGDDRFFQREASAGGTVITDAEGHNRLKIETDDVLGFERVGHSDNLYILLGGGDTYDRTRDVVWVDFFGNPHNRINGLNTAKIDELAVFFSPPIPPAELTPTISEFINAANWTYSRDAADLPADLTAFVVNGEHLTLEVTGHGFYGAAFLTPLNQVVVAFEGTNLSALEEDPLFAVAQIAADGLIYLGESPAAYADALAFTQTVLAAASLRGITAEDVFVTGHSLGAAEAMYVAAQLDLAGTTFAAPGIPAAAIPAGNELKLVDYVEYGDPLGNYSANPNYLGEFLYDEDILRFGDATYLGDPLARLALEAAGDQFGPGTTPAENAAGIAALAALATEYHVLTAYAEELGVTLEDPDGLGDAGAEAAVLLAGVFASLVRQAAPETQCSELI